MRRRLIRRPIAARPGIRRRGWVTWVVILGVLVLGVILCRACGVWGRIF
jgi:hypothetical protein